MTSQEPPLTRREARERERLLQEQAASPTPDAQALGNQTLGNQTSGNQAADASAPASSAPSPFPPAQAAPRPTNPFAPPAPAATPPAPALASQQAAPVSARQLSAVSASPAGAAPAGSLAGTRTPERTLTRRELRAMLDAHHLDDELDDEAIDDPVASFVPQGAAQQAAPQAAAFQQSAPASPVVASPPAAPATPSVAPAQAPAQAQAEAAPRRLPTAPPVVQAAPKASGHWTEQLDVEEVRAEPFDQLLSRGGVSRGVPTTTNALILPSLPAEGGQIVTPLAGGGDVIVTGSIDLPRSYGATGVHPSQVDSSDIDRLFDNVEDAPTTGVAPVAATRAISTQAASKQMMMAPPKKDGPNVPLVLAVTAGVLALGVVATLVIGAVFRLF